MKKANIHTVILLLCLQISMKSSYGQFYLGAEGGGVVNETEILSNVSGVLVDNEFGSNVVGHYYFNIGWREKRHLFEMSYGKLQHVFRITTSVVEEEDLIFYTTKGSVRDYDYIGMNYYYNLLSNEERNLSLYAGGGISISSLPQDEQGGDNIRRVSRRKLLENCQTDSLQVIQDVVGERKTSFIGIELKLRLDIKVLERLNIGVNNKVFLWANKEVLTKDVTTIFNGESPNYGKVRSYMPYYSLGVGIYYRL